MKQILLLGLLFFSIHSINGQTTWYVRPTSVGLQNGSSWANAFSDIQPALQVAKSGDQIWVAQNFYKPTQNADRSAFWDFPSGVRMYGGFLGNETQFSSRNPNLRTTVLSGDIGIAENHSDNSYNLIRMVNPGDSTIVDGFKFQYAHANQEGGLPGEMGTSGAAIFIDARNGMAKPIIENCVFTSNSASSLGGGIMIQADSESVVAPRMNNCSFFYNQAYQGGAIYRMGGAPLSNSIDFFKCGFLQNRTQAEGSAIFYKEFDNQSDTLDLVKCSFTQNISDGASDKPMGAFYTSGRKSGTYLQFKQTSFSTNLARKGSDFVFDSDENPLARLSFDEGVFYNTSTSSGSNALGNGIYVHSAHLPGNTKPKLILKQLNINYDYINVIYYDCPDFLNVQFENTKITGYGFQYPAIQLPGIDSLVFIKNKFTGNLGAINWPVRSDAIFTQNLLYGSGLGIQLSETASPALVANNVFDGTNAFSSFRLQGKFNLLNNLFINNAFSLSGDAVPALNKATAINNIFVNNRNQIHTNSAKAYQFLPFEPDSVAFSFNVFDFLSCDSLDGKGFCGDGNFFVSEYNLEDTAAQLYRPLPCNPGIQAGLNEAVLNAGLQTDYLGKARIQDGVVEIGPYELLPISEEAPPSVTHYCDSALLGSIYFNLSNTCGPYSYTWEKSGVNGIGNNQLYPGTYYFTITDSYGRTINIKKDVYDLNPYPDENVIPASCSTCLDGEIYLNYFQGFGVSEILWSNGATLSYVQGLAPGQYTVTITSDGFCSATASITVPFVLSDQDINATNVRIDVFPNPVTDALVVRMPIEVNACKMSFYDVLGRYICTKNLVSGGNNIEISDWAAGLYTFRIWEGGNLLRSGKVVKR